MVAAMLVVLLPGCAGGSDPAPEAVAQTLVGRVQGTEVYVALQLGVDGGAQAYLCDSTDIAQALSGTEQDGAVQLTGEQGVQLSGQVDRGAASGTVVVDGAEHPFTAELATGDAGFYRAAGEGVVIGWVLLNDGTQRGALKEITDRGEAQDRDRDVGFAERLQPAPTLDPRRPLLVPHQGKQLEVRLERELSQEQVKVR